jgi:hypothetical protein
MWRRESGRAPNLNEAVSAYILRSWVGRDGGTGFSAQRPARDRALTRIPDSPPRRAALCAESVESLRPDLSGSPGRAGFSRPIEERQASASLAQRD